MTGMARNEHQQVASGAPEAFSSTSSAHAFRVIAGAPTAAALDDQLDRHMQPAALSRPNQTSQTSQTSHLRDMTDAQLLVQLTHNKDQAALATLIERHYDIVYQAAARQLANDPTLSEDAAQNTFMLFADKAATLGPAINIAGWLVRSAGYTAANLRRKEYRRQHQSLDMTEPATFNPTHSHSQSHSQSQFENRECLEQLLATLPEKTKQAVVWHHLEGHPQKDVASRLGCSVEAAKKRIQYGMKKMREHVQARAAAFAGMLAFLLWPRRGHAHASRWTGPALSMSVITALVTAHWLLTEKSTQPIEANEQLAQITAPAQDEAIGQLGPFIWSRAENIDETGQISNAGDALAVSLQGSTFFEYPSDAQRKQIHTRNTLVAATNNWHFTWQPQTFSLGTTGNHDMKILIGYAEQNNTDQPMFVHGDNRDLMYQAPSARVAMFLPIRHGGRDPANPAHYHVTTSYKVQSPCIVEMAAGTSLQHHDWNVPFHQDRRILYDLVPLFRSRQDFQPGISEPLFDFRLGAARSWRLSIEWDGRDGLAGGDDQHSWDTVITDRSPNAQPYTVAVDPSQAAWAMSVINPGGRPHADAQLDSLLHPSDRLTGAPLAWDEVLMRRTVQSNGNAGGLAQVMAQVRSQEPTAWYRPGADG
jgi:RNA polymerase sigma-70 factor (ECF subfamily)